MKTTSNNVELQKYYLLLKACKMSGGDIVLYQKLHLSNAQLIQVLKGLEKHLDVSYYLDPKFTAMQMSILRKGLKEGLDLKVWLQKGFDWMQLEEIYLGYKNNLPIEDYCILDYNSAQMKQIRLGLMKQLDVSVYLSPKFSANEMNEIRKGLEKGLDVSKYATPKYDSIMMREIRRALQDDFDYEPYLKKGCNSKILRQLRKSKSWGYDILPYVEGGYSADQIEQIGMCFQQNIDIKPYINPKIDFRQIREIRLGFEAGVAVDLYKDTKFNWEQMEQIRLGLEAGLDVNIYANPSFSAYIMKSSREKLLFAKESAKEKNAASLSELEIKASIQLEQEAEQVKGNSFAQTKSKKLPKENTVSIDSQGMEATLFVLPPTPEEPYTVEKLVSLLSSSNVKQGVNLSALEAIINNETYNEYVTVARGKESMDGKDGFYTYHFNTSKIDNTPAILPDGSVDYFNKKSYEFVKEGQLLAEYTPATVGEYGFTVTGKLLMPKRGKDLPAIKGKGHRYDEEKKAYYATLSGQIEFENNKITIVNCLSISKDVDYSVGNIDFDGNVEINGNVIPNMSIRASGYVKINGYVDSASIYAGGDVILSKGVQGGDVSTIESGGNITAPFFESTTINCKGTLNADHILNCDITSDNAVILSGKRGLILGGVTRALRYIDAKTVGNKAELPTAIILGVDTQIIKDFGTVSQEISKLKLELSGLKKNTTIYEEQQQTEHYTYQMLQKTIASKKNVLNQMQKKLDEYNNTIALAANSCLGVQNFIYPGVEILINAEHHKVNDVQENVTYRLRNRQVIMEEYQPVKDTPDEPSKTE